MTKFETYSKLARRIHYVISRHKEVSLESYIDFTPEVKEALITNKPVVALESTIISHGMPFPENLKTAAMLEELLRSKNVIPATIALINGKIKIGLNAEELQLVGESKDVWKTSRRDIPFVLSTKKIGATTVAATMIAASLAKIPVFATGGIGGVHRGAELSMDISADLLELAQTNVAVVSAGVKSILDLPKTLEVLETQGVPVIGYKTSEFPSFYCRTSGLRTDFQMNTAKEIAEFMRMKWQLKLNGGLLISNPIPDAFAMDEKLINQKISEALKQAELLNIKGKEITPFLLKNIKEATAGKSLIANIELVKNNVVLAAEIATEYSQNFNLKLN